ncbi:MAG: DUF1007 family protein [Roseobacter sp.]
MLRNFWCLFLCIMCLGGSAGAHPHVFVDARTGFIFDADGHLEAMRISWTYDEFTSLVLFETLSLDQDGDGQLNETDYAAIIAGETDWAPDYKGDVYLEVAGQDYPLGRPAAAQVTFEDNKVEVSFNLPLSQPIKIDSAPAFLRLYDPGFYYAYTILQTMDAYDAPEGCDTQVVSFEPNAAENVLQEKLATLGRDEAPIEENVGLLFSDEVHLTCG